MAETASISLVARVMKAGSWALIGNVASQILRFGSNLILTRLLFPEAFGLMAITQSILLAAHLLSDVGLQQSVIRSDRGHEPSFLNTVWTLQIVKGALIFAVMSAAGLVAARAYSQPLLVALIPVMGLGAFIGGFASTNLALLNRRIAVGKLTAIELGAQFVGIVVMILWAKVWPSPWALVAGNLANALAMVIASHFYVGGERNRFAWDKSVVREIWSFGSWVMLSSSVTFLAGEGRNLLNAALVDARVVGLIVLSSTLAFVLWNAIQQITGRVLFPAYAEVWRERPHNFPAVVERSRRIQLLAGCAAAAMFAVFGDAIVRLFYDSRYWQAGILLQIQAVGTIFSFLSASYSGVLWAMGRPGMSAVMIGGQVLVMGALTILGYALAGPMGVVVGGACTGLVIYPFNAYLYSRIGLFQWKTDWWPIAIGIGSAIYVYHDGHWAIAL